MQTSARHVDGNGFFRVDRNPLSKTGVFPYMGSELPNAPDVSKVYRVLRPPEELGSPETIASFSLVPVVDEHTWIGPGGTPVDNKPVYGVSGESVEFDGTYLTAPLKIFNLPPDPKAELSCGYACEYDWTPGIWNGEPYDAVQRKIRGNHVALVWEGRMGPDVRVLDHLPTIAFDSLEYVKMPDNTGSMTLEEVSAKLAELAPLAEMVANLQAQITAAQTPPEAAAAAVEAEEVAGEVSEAANEVELAAAAVEAAPSEEEAAPVMDELDKKEKGLDAKLTKLNGLKVATSKGLDAAIKAGSARAAAAKARGVVKTKGLDARVKGLESSAGDSAVAAIAKRDELATRLHKQVGVFDHKPMTLGQVAAYGAEKLNLPKDTSADSLDVFLKGRESVATVSSHVGDAAPATGTVADYIKTNQER